MRRIALALVTLAVLAAAGPAAADPPQQQNYYAAGIGTFNATGGPFTNHFIFGAATSTNGSGGRGELAVADFQNRVYYTADVTCLYVDPTTHDATIWGLITMAHTAGAVVGGSVLLHVRPGTARTSPPAGFGNFLFASAPPSTCSGVTSPPASPIASGAITTGGS